MNIITYQLKLEDGRSYAFEIDIDRPTENLSAEIRHHAAWTELANNRCSNCPHDPAATHYCPAAIDIEEIAEQFVQTLPPVSG